MDYRDGKKCLDEILAAVKPEDEEQYFCNVEYLEHYRPCKVFWGAWALRLMRRGGVP